ncbi:MAG TPA: glycosyltransferase, partial [Methylomirabilota bacterium]|nr:glycosyltransferase [Methylomirabilota bacterium]
AMLNIPIIIHEQIFGAGLANKIAARFAQKICISWEDSRKFFSKEKVVLTGNPLRKEFFQSVIAAPRNDEKVISITGGSSGSHAINVLIEGCLQKLLEKYTVIHQTGDAKKFGDFDRLEKLKAALSPSLQKKYRLTKFVDSTEVLSILSKAHLVVSRSGINTVTELLALGKPSLFIPFPYGQHNEQLINAMFVKKIGLAEVAEEVTLTPDKLYILIDTVLQNIEKYQRNSTQAKRLINSESTQKIISLISYVNEQKKIKKS